MRVQRVDIIAFFTALTMVATGFMGYKMWSDSVERAERIAAWKEKRVEQAKEVEAKIAEPASTWYALRGINLDSFVEGDDPPISFDSEVRKPFILKWTIQAHSVEAKSDFPPVCATGDTYIRTPNDNAGLTIIRWSELWKRNPCHLPSGKYLLKGQGTLKIVGYPDKEVERASNIFTVLEKGSELYVKPERVEQLQKAQELLEKPVK